MESGVHQTGGGVHVFPRCMDRLFRVCVCLRTFVRQRKSGGGEKSHILKFLFYTLMWRIYFNVEKPQDVKYG